MLWHFCNERRHPSREDSASRDVIWVVRCRVCPYAIRMMGYIVRKLNAVPSTAPWLAVRLSYGMNGILMPMRNLPSLTSYLK